MSALHRHHDKNDNNNNEYNNVIWTIRFCNKCAYFVNVRDEQYEQGILKIFDIVMMFIIIVYLGCFFFVYALGIKINLLVTCCQEHKYLNSDLNKQKTNINRDHQ